MKKKRMCFKCFEKSNLKKKDVKIIGVIDCLIKTNDDLKENSEVKSE